MDMSGSYVAATRAQAPQAAIVHGKFHVAKILNEAVDQTRRAEHACRPPATIRSAAPLPMAARPRP
jgi:transposase